MPPSPSLHIPSSSSRLAHHQHHHQHHHQRQSHHDQGQGQSQPQPQPQPQPQTQRLGHRNDHVLGPGHAQIQQTYNVAHTLGRGCFAQVFKAERRVDKLPVAIKLIDKHRLDEDTSSLLHNELRILQTVSQHPGIVTLLDSLETDTHMYFVMEYVQGGPLLDRIVSRANFSENDARIMLRSILVTLQFLSNLGFVHRDIKPENILVDNHSDMWPVKLTDFGLSTKMQPDKLLHGALGTPLFVAPELLKGHGYDSSCDMWSLGVVLYIVLCGYPPFPFYDGPRNLISSIIACDYSFSAPEWCKVSSHAKDIVTRMLDADPKTRITPSDALNHPWITMMQSTNDLPNKSLQRFNARRKLKAAMFGVLTTFDLKNIIHTPRGAPQAAVTQQELREDVERNRTLIEKMGFLDQSPTGAENESPSEEDQPALRPSRRSLILPVSVFDTAPVQNSSSSEVGATSHERLYGNAHHDTFDSQVLQSRAEAMVADIKESAVQLHDTNPFLIAEQDAETSADGETTRPYLSFKELDFRNLRLP